MKINFLSASMPLTKSYTLEADGSITKSSYPHAYEFTSHVEQCPDLPSLLRALDAHAAQGHCMVKGELNKTLVSESRAGSTNTQDATDWLCLDIDGLPDTYAPNDATPLLLQPYTVDLLMLDIGLPKVSYVLQWSASYGIADKLLRCHVFVQLDRKVSAPLIKQWLIHLNHATPHLRASQALTKTGNSLTWPLDITACQNDKLLYIASPVLKKVKNPLGKLPRTSLVRKAQQVFTFPQNFNAAKNRDLTDTRIQELRDALGLPKRKMTYKVVGGNEVLVKPDSCDATEIRHERGFTYFNINGGDSWAYYHPENCPDYIYNFKGEPVYKTSELLPDYWKSLQQSGTRQAASGLIYLAFCDSKTGVYLKGSYDPATDTLDLTPAKTLIILTHYMLQHGMVPGDHIPEWDVYFDPNSAITVDFANKTVNTFQLTSYMKASQKIVKQCPPTIFKFMHHALGSDADITERYVNWLACLFQYRDRTQTSWVLHGTEGTGKGVLINKILRPLLGRNLRVVTMRELSSPYNAYMRDALLVICEEMQSSTMNDEEGVMAVVRLYITDELVPIRAMYAQEVICRNYCNWMFPSNKPDVIKIPKGDRRTSVAKFQPVRFYPQTKDLAMWAVDGPKIERELQSFYDFLMSYPADIAIAGTPMKTDARDTMIDITENAIDTVSSALLDGDMEFFVDQLPTSDKYKIDPVLTNKVETYRSTLHDILMRTDALTGKVNIARDELRSLYEYTLGKIPESPNKFTSLIKHHGIHTKKVWVANGPVMGISTEFKDIANFGTYLKSNFKVKAKTP